MFGCDDPYDFLNTYGDIASQFYVDPTTRRDITAKLAERGEVTGYEARGWRKNRSTFWMRESARVVRDRSGQIVGYEGFIEDITEQKAAHEALKHAFAQLQDAQSRVDIANRAKSTFLTNMTQELRTPLNTIIGFASVLRDPAFAARDPETFHRYCSNIEDNARHLLGIVNGILEMAQSEARELSLFTESVDLAALIRDCVPAIRPRADTGNVSVNLAGLPESCMIEGDIRRLRQVVVNLVSNAVKFTPAGGEAWINLDVGSEFVTVLISDTGVGIAESDISRAMQPFQQLERSLNNRVDGAGLGLPLAKDLVELHGGRLQLDSTPDVGTTAYVHLPRWRNAGESGTDDTVESPECDI
jgi:signal transduction histidine kinase